MTGENNPYKNKAVIRERMRGFAARYFGVSRTELLDPAVNLMLESLSEEVYKIAGAIDDTEDRIRDRLVQLLTPATESIARPAHAIFHAQAREAFAGLSTQTEFQCTRPRGRFSFYPVCNTRVCNGSIRCFIHNESVYALNSDQTHTQLSRSGKKDPSLSHAFWIGLELDHAIDNLLNLSFYVDFQGVSNREKYLNLLPYARWKIQDRELKIRRGIYCIEEETDNDILRFFSAQDFSYQINQKIKNEYNVHFFTVGSDTPAVERETFPEKLKAYFPEHVRQRLTQPLLWIEVSCPAEFSPEIMDSMQISLNAFPVAGKQLIDRTVEINRFAPVIPLHTGANESFISVRSLSDTQGKQYYDMPLNDTNEAAYGVYSLSRGGYERYGRREALEFLSSMADTVSGKASFFIKNENDVNAGLKQVSLEAGRLAKYLDKILTGVKERYEVENYILLEPESSGEIYFLSYWITGGAEANGIPAGTLMQAPGEPALEPASLVFLSATRGGRQAPQSLAREHAHKDALSEHGLLITNEDIMNFCRKRFGDFIREVKVCKGIQKSEDPRKGFTPAINVYLTVRKEMEKYVQDRTVFEQELKAHSPETYRYRVILMENYK